MVADALEQYIAEQLACGYSPQALRSFLISRGHMPERVDDIIRRIQPAPFTGDKATPWNTHPDTTIHTSAKSAEPTNPWKMAAILLVLLFIIAAMYVYFSVLGYTPIPQQNSPDRTSALLFLAETKHYAQAVPLAQSSRILTYRVGDEFEKVCVIDWRKNPTIDDKVLRNTAERDRSKNLFLISRNKEIGFQSVTGFDAGAVTAADGIMCTTVKNGWTSLRFTAEGLRALITPA